MIGVLAQKGVRLRHRAPDDSNWQFFVRRSGEQSLGHGRDRTIMDGPWRRHIGAAQLWPGQVAPLKLACSCGHDERLSSEPLVTMMEASDLWERDDLAGLGWVYRAALRTILVEREVRSRRVVVSVKAFLGSRARADLDPLVLDLQPVADDARLQRGLDETALLGRREQPTLIRLRHGGAEVDIHGEGDRRADIRRTALLHAFPVAARVHRDVGHLDLQASRKGTELHHDAGGQGGGEISQRIGCAGIAAMPGPLIGGQVIDLAGQAAGSADGDVVAEAAGVAALRVEDDVTADRRRCVGHVGLPHFSGPGIFQHGQRRHRALLGRLEEALVDLKQIQDQIARMSDMQNLIESEYRQYVQAVANAKAFGR